jgi:hypothetical protein
MARGLSQFRPIPRFGLSRIEAAMAFGISPTLFDRLVSEKRVPAPRLIYGRKVWDVNELAAAFEEFLKDDTKNTWSDFRET